MSKPQILTASLRPASSSPYTGQPGPPYWPPLPGGISTGWAPILLAIPTCVRCWIWEPGRNTAATRSASTAHQREAAEDAFSSAHGLLRGEGKAGVFQTLCRSLTSPEGSFPKKAGGRAAFIPPPHDADTRLLTCRCRHQMSGDEGVTESDLKGAKCFEAVKKLAPSCL